MAQHTIIDRRQNPRGKNLPNRQRFLRRTARNIRRYLDRTFSGDITGSSDQEVRVDQDDVAEHSFGYDYKTGDWDRVLPGNRDFVVGDKIPRPRSGQGGGGGPDAGSGESQDDFVFQLTREEYFDIIFDGLELPRLEKKTQVQTKSETRSRAGFSHDGPSNNLDLVRTLKNSIGRRLALARPLDAEIAELEQQLENTTAAEKRAEIQLELDELRARRATVCYIDPVDLRFRRHEIRPDMQSQAVMFCVMDVSASMTEREKEVAKRFFLLLYLFLDKNYERVDVVFIRHTDQAQEVTEQEFFHGTYSGGTTVSSGIQLMLDIQTERYPSSDWNVYAVQASDGDNYSSDNALVKNLLQKFLSDVQFYVYNEISDQSKLYEEYSGPLVSDLYTTLASLKTQHEQLELNVLESADQVVANFRKIFSAQRAQK
jgi:uncharacterized protein